MALGVAYFSSLLKLRNICATWARLACPWGSSFFCPVPFKIPYRTAHSIAGRAKEETLSRSVKVW